MARKMNKPDTRFEKNKTIKMDDLIIDWFHVYLKQVLSRHFAQSIGVSAYFLANFCEFLISCFVRRANGLLGG